MSPTVAGSGSASRSTTNRSASSRSSLSPSRLPDIAVAIASVAASVGAIPASPAMKRWYSTL